MNDTHMSPHTFKFTLSQFTCNQKPFDWQQWKLLINGLHQGLWHSRADTYIKCLIFLLANAVTLHCVQSWTTPISGSESKATRKPAIPKDPHH